MPDLLDAAAFSIFNRRASRSLTDTTMDEAHEAQAKPAAPAAAPAVAAVPPAEPPALQWYKVRLAFWQAICGMIVSGGVAVAIPAGVEVYKAHLELQKTRQELVLKEKEIEEKRIDQYQDYVSKFLTTALNQDIELRLRFSEYFSFVADRDSVDRWKSFHDRLEKRRDDVRQRIEQNEVLAGRLRAVANPDTAQQIELARIARDLRWDYAELGYAQQDTNITAPATALPTSIAKEDVVADDAMRFAAATVDATRSAQIGTIVDAIVASRSRYETVAAATGVPWYVIAILHREETNGVFTMHMNGDPLSERTAHPPKDIPATAIWEDSAIEFVRRSRLTEDLADYGTSGGTLYVVERFNGLGSRRRGSSSPYVWACTDQYVNGGSANFGSSLVTVRQGYCGFAAILKTMVQRGIVTLHSF